MCSKKIIILAIFFCLFFRLAAEIKSESNNAEIIHLRYKCRIETSNPLWRIFFFIFIGDSREFLWHEKRCEDEYDPYREIIVLRNGRQVAVFFSQGEFSSFGKTNFGNDELGGNLDARQVKKWFEMQNFSQTAAPGDIYTTDYRTSESDFKITIKAQDFSRLAVCGETVDTLSFEGTVMEGDEKYIDAKYWVIREGNLKGQVAKCTFRKGTWPRFLIEISGIEIAE